MNKMLVDVNMFDVNTYKIYINKDNNIISSFNIKEEDVISTIFSFVDTYNIDTIMLYGNAKFCEGLRTKIQAKEINQYGKTNLLINII